MPKPNFPFSDGGSLPNVPTAMLGGMLVPVSGGAASANRLIAHGLGRVPRFHWFWDIGNNAAFSTPRPRGTSAWSTTVISLNWPSTGATCYILIG